MLTEAELAAIRARHHWKTERLVRLNEGTYPHDFQLLLAECDRLTTALAAERARVATLVAAGDALFMTTARLYNPDDRMTIMDALALARLDWRAARKEVDHADRG